MVVHVLYWCEAHIYMYKFTPLCPPSIRYKIRTAPSWMCGLETNFRCSTARQKKFASWRHEEQRWPHCNNTNNCGRQDIVVFRDSSCFSERPEGLPQGLGSSAPHAPSSSEQTACQQTASVGSAHTQPQTALKDETQQ